MAESHVVLRASSVLDAEALAKAANHQEVYNGLRDYFPFPYTVDDGLRFIEQIQEQARAGPRLHWIIEVDGCTAGVMSLFVGEDVYRLNAELGYWLGPSFWGRGIMTQAIRQTVAYAWRELAVQRLFATVFGNNIASRRVLEKSGFELEYTLPQTVIKRGEVTDELCFGLRRPQT